MSDIDVRRQALREIAKEKSSIRGEVPSEPSLEEDREGQEQEAKELQEEGMSFKQASPEKIILEKRREGDSTFPWTSFAPWKKEKKEKPMSLNTVTIWCMARKEIAQEWREARGVTKKDCRKELLEREAAMWQEKREEERRRQEEVKARFEKQRVKVDEALKIIGQKILEEKDNLTAEGAITIIEDAMGAIGKTYNVEWRRDGCDIWIEPWEERWSRQNRGLPAIYKIGINDELKMASHDVIKGEDVRLKVKEEMLANQLEKPLDEEPLGADEEDIKDALEKRTAEVGRLIEFKKMKENTWLTTVEPWEDMRIRNVERKGEGPIETESILAKVVDGDLIMAPLKPEDRGQMTEKSDF